MRKLLLSIFILSSLIVSAQEEEEEEVLPSGWSSEGKVQLLFNQSAFNKEWTGGGTSSIAANAMIDYNIHYKKGDFTWDTRLLGNYGLTKLKNDEYLRKTSDRFEINSIAGKQVAESNWYYSFFINFRTQFTEGYVYSKDATGAEVRRQTTNFISPAYLQFGPGMMWKKSENLWVNIAPGTGRFIFVDGKFTSLEGYVDKSYYGIEVGKNTRFELGASISAYSQEEIMENVSIENTLSLYSNYLDEPENIDIDYLMNLTLGINKYLTANLIFQAIYDDNTIGAFQIREVFGAGFNYSF